MMGSTSYSITFLLFQLFLHLLLNEGRFQYGCKTVERDALFKFKHTLYDHSNRLSSWKGEDCCDWDGVGCDNITGHIRHLDLLNPNMYCDRSSNDSECTSTELRGHNLEPSLVNLTNLRYLDLGWNNFQDSSIPEFIGSMKKLRYLDLSYASFGGVLPPQLGNLTSLRYLVLSQNSFNGSVPLWLRDMKALEYVDLSQNSLSHIEGGSLMGIVGNLCNLEDLDLSFNSIQGQIIGENNNPKCIANSLERFRLGSNRMTGTLPPQLGNLTSLMHLDLQDNSFSGSVPLWLRNLKALEEIYLGDNSFSQIEGGSLMGIVGNLCNLYYLDLSYNYIQGEINGENNYPKCMGNSLESLNLGSNRMTGTLPSWLGDLTNLKELILNENRFHGQIPTSIGRLSSLRSLYLYSNSLEGTLSESHFANLSSLEHLKLGSNSLNLNFTSAWIPPFQLYDFDMSHCDIQGPFPQWIQTQYNLVSLDLSSNSLEGTVSESHFANTSGLRRLELGSNSLNLNFTSSWIPPFQLEEFHMSYCDIQGPFPQWIQTQYDLGYLDLSHNRIVGPLPLLPSSLWAIQLSHNLLSGPLSQYQVFTNPNYNATLTTSFCQLTHLYFILLENNLFNGTIPNDCWSNSTSSLYVINLSNNKLQGQIPTTLFGTLFPSLHILDLGGNKLTGQVPAVTGTQLSILRLRDNQLGGVIPLQLCSLPRLQILDLANNNLAGSIPNCLGHLYGMTLKLEVIYLIDLGVDEGIIEVLKGEILSHTNKMYLVNMDLSYNGLVGSIPEELSNLSTLVGLNLSYNHLTGRIPKKIGQMTSLESLDLSNNNIYGTIPASITALGFLSHLNLSHNKLHGEIPPGHQLQTLNDPSIYAGNSGLCGDPLPDKCKRGDKQDHGKERESKQEDGEEDRFEKTVFCCVIILGFVTGFWAVIGTLLLKKQWRHALFRRVEDFMDYLYVQVMVKINRLKG